MSETIHPSQEKERKTGMFYHTKQKPLQDVIERCDGLLAMVTGRGRRENQGTIKTKDVANELKDAGFTARQVKTGSYVIWRHETLPGHNIILQKKAYLPLSAAIQIRQTIQKVKAKSSSQIVLDVIDIDKISLGVPTFFPCIFPAKQEKK